MNNCLLVGMIVASLLLLLCPLGLEAGAAERRLIRMLLEQPQQYDPMVHPVSEAEYVPLRYNPLERPVTNEKESVPLKFGIA